MIRTDLPSSNLAPAFQSATAAVESRAGGSAATGERFGDFTAFAAEAGGETVGLGRGRASIDAQHAARSVTAFLLGG